MPRRSFIDDSRPWASSTSYQAREMDRAGTGFGRLQQTYAANARDIEYARWREEEYIPSYFPIVPEQGARPAYRLALPTEPTSDPRRHRGPTPDFDNMPQANVWRRDAPLAERARWYLRKYGRKLVPLGRFLKRVLPFAGRGLNTVGELIDLFSMLNQLHTSPRPGGWTGNGVWELYQDCGTGIASHYEANPSHFFPAYNCLANQVQGPIGDRPNWTWPPASVSAAANTLIVGLGWDFFAFWYLNNNQWWRRIAPGTVAPSQAPARMPFPMPNPHPNPNALRRLPRTAQPVPRPSYGLMPDLLTPPHVSPGSRIERAIRGATGVSPAGWTGTQNWGPPIRTPTPTRSRPKDPETKERKVMTGSKRLAIALFKILDVVSEWSEVVDAFYRALPEEVRRANPCADRRGLGDNAGQYGISGADCKGRVVYENFHLVDPLEAITNVVKNEVEDSIHGGIHRHLPKQAGGPGMNNQGLALGDLLNALGL